MPVFSSMSARIFNHVSLTQTGYTVHWTLSIFISAFIILNRKYFFNRYTKNFCYIPC